MDKEVNGAVFRRRTLELLGEISSSLKALAEGAAAPRG